jgi:hypothetical protein
MPHFTLATWKVEKLFRPPQVDHAAYDGKVTFLKQRIQAMNPDVIA